MCFVVLCFSHYLNVYFGLGLEKTISTEARIILAPVYSHFIVAALWIYRRMCVCILQFVMLLPANIVFSWKRGLFVLFW